MNPVFVENALNCCSTVQPQWAQAYHRPASAPGPRQRVLLSVGSKAGREFKDHPIQSLHFSGAETKTQKKKDSPRVSQQIKARTSWHLGFWTVACPTFYFALTPPDMTPSLLRPWAEARIPGLPENTTLNYNCSWWASLLPPSPLPQKRARSYSSRVLAQCLAWKMHMLNK